MTDITTGQHHFTEAERLLEEGRKVVEEIRAVPSRGVTVTSSLHLSQKERRDALGKQATGIWAQAAAHAAVAQAWAASVEANVALRSLGGSTLLNGGSVIYKGGPRE